MKTCTDCLGYGYIQTPGVGVSGFHKCATCNGRGVIEETREESIKRTLKESKDAYEDDIWYENRTKDEIWADKKNRS